MSLPTDPRQRAAPVVILTDDGLGKAVQVDPIKRTLKAPGINRLKLQYDEPPSNFALCFNLSRYTSASPTMTTTTTMIPPVALRQARLRFRRALLDSRRARLDSRQGHPGFHRAHPDSPRIRPGCRRGRQDSRRARRSRRPVPPPARAAARTCCPSSGAAPVNPKP